MSLSDFLASWLPPIDDEMRAVLGQAADPAFAPLYGMLHYHLGWADADFRPASIPAGKRIRPVVCLLACQAAGGDPRLALPAAAAVELLHNFSLIHDDVEDRSELRRGRPTLWTVWGLAQAINAGDALFALAHSAFHRLGERGVPVDRQAAAHRRFTQTCLQLTQGQHLDLDFESRSQVSTDEYLTMIEGKTAALVSGAAAIGAIIAGSDRVQRYADFGMKLGLAFQIQDDLLGIWGDPQVTGKSAASDIASRKKSLPVLYGLQLDAELQALFAAPQVDVARAVRLLEKTGARQYAEEAADRCTGEALEALEAAQSSQPAGSWLRELATSLLQRRA